VNQKLKKIIIFFLAAFCLFLINAIGLNFLQNAAANGKIILKGQVALEGRAGITDANPTFLQIRIKRPQEDKAIFRDDYVPTTQDVQKNDNIYYFEIDLTGKIGPGDYGISVKEWHYLDSLKNIDLAFGENNLDFGAPQLGDIDNDDYIDIDASGYMGRDPEIFYPLLGQKFGNVLLPPYPSIEQPVPWHADINNDGIVDADDENLMLLQAGNSAYGPGAINAGDLRLTNPNNYSPVYYPVYTEGDTRTIQWGVSTKLSAIKLQYSLNGGSFTDLTGEIPNTGEYRWQVPSEFIASDLKLKTTLPRDSFYYLSSRYMYALGDYVQLSVLPKRITPSYPTANNVLVVYNNIVSINPNFASQPEGKEIAEYYLSKRPGASLLAIDIPDSVRLGTYGEEILRDNYEQYIRNPIKIWLDANTNKDIRYIVLTKGIPLKIKPGTSGEEASVDIELSALYSDYNKIYDSKKSHYSYAIHNPFYYYRFVNDNPFKDDGFQYLFQPNYFYVFYSANPTAKFKINYLVTRLDGYSVADVKAMIDRGVEASQGYYYWILDDGGKGLDGYEFDRMMGNFKQLVLNNKWAKIVLEEDFGLADYVVYQNLKQPPLYSNPQDPQGQVIAYVGWGVYDGYPDNCITDLFDFNLAPGALYSSYESFNAWGFHDKDQSVHTQLGEWIAIGGTGGVGNVYEPYATAIANEAIWMPAYAAGYPLADAFYLSLPYSSWTQVVIGDPLANIRTLPNQAPTITGLTVTSASGQSPLTVGFTAQAQDSDGIIAGYSWNFGDGGTSTQQNPNYIYNNAGNYTAILTVVDNSGATSTKNITIVVTSPLLPADTIPPSSPSGLQASINDNQITLSWINPQDSDFAKVRILQKEDNYPTNTNDGRIVYDGNKASYIDAGLINDKIYYYAVFACDNALNWSNAAIIQAVPKANIILEPPITQEEKISLLKAQIKSLIERILILKYKNIPADFKFSKKLKRGFKGDEVKYLQIVLKIETDGVFGLKTDKAVKEFQKSHGLVADGIVGIKTRAELNNIIKR